MVEAQDNINTLDGSLSHFGKAFADNSTVISQLSEANNSIHETIQGNIANLTNKLESMNNAQQHLALNANQVQEPSQQHLCLSQPQFQGFNLHIYNQCGRGCSTRRSNHAQARRGGYHQCRGFQFNPTPPTF